MLKEMIQDAWNEIKYGAVWVLPALGVLLLLIALVALLGQWVILVALVTGLCFVAGKVRRDFKQSAAETKAFNERMDRMRGGR